ncbi:TetR/AcrR family transcriptional regulator [Bacillus rubiinfantis]|uniref:TetR/AcrR family transcriptional regulator n=1 Tax=Bacillus rubiinfantis TaxID=1499680 RepID=UPI0005A61393|nr:TetR/AcrR family transcriptional regulator [Bacillus rubiinfantis]
MSKKQLIIEAALELFAKQGFEATSVQQITDHCGISKGAFYLSFKSKDELIFSLIDHFMMQITSDIDHIVRESQNEDLLLRFYFSVYQTFQRHSDFAKVLMIEQSQTLNKDLFLKMQTYEKLIDNMILTMLSRLYGEAIEQTKYDLLYCVKGFMNMYSHLFIFHHIPLDLELLAQSLVEKTNVLARNMNSPFISADLYQIVKQPLTEEISQEKLLGIIVQKVAELEDSVEKESLDLLRGQVLHPSLPPAIVKGLLENIRQHPHCKWVAYLLRGYFEKAGLL